MLAAEQFAQDNQEAADASDHRSHNLGNHGLGYRKSSDKYGPDEGGSEE